MTLPDGFRWIPASQHEKGDPRALAIGEEMVAMLIDRIDGSWFVRLDCQLGISAPLVTRPCRSFESGRQGTEIWAARHEARLRAQVREKIARRGRHISGPAVTDGGQSRENSGSGSGETRV